MGWSGGIFSRVFNNWVTDAATTPTITAARHDVNDDDLEAGINACVPADGSKAMTGDLPMGGKKITGLAAGANNGDALRYEQAVGVFLPKDGSVAMTGVLNLAALGAKCTVDVVTPAGSIQADATALTGPMAFISGGSSGQGVRLPAISSWGVGRPVLIATEGAGGKTYKVYAAPGGDSFMGQVATEALDLTTSTGYKPAVLCIPVTSTQWVYFSGGEGGLL